MKTVELLHTPGAELEATAPQERRCGGAAASASARSPGSVGGTAENGEQIFTGFPHPGR